MSNSEFFRAFEHELKDYLQGDGYADYYRFVYISLQRNVVNKASLMKEYLTKIREAKRKAIREGSERISLPIFNNGLQNPRVLRYGIRDDHLGEEDEKEEKGGERSLHSMEEDGDEGQGLGEHDSFRTKHSTARLTGSPFLQQQFNLAQQSGQGMPYKIAVHKIVHALETGDEKTASGMVNAVIRRHGKKGYLWLKKQIPKHLH